MAALRIFIIFIFVLKVLSLKTVLSIPSSSDKELAFPDSCNYTVSQNQVFQLQDTAGLHICAENTGYDAKVQYKLMGHSPDVTNITVFLNQDAGSTCENTCWCYEEPIYTGTKWDITSIPFDFPPNSMLVFQFCTASAQLFIHDLKIAGSCDIGVGTAGINC